MNSKHIGADMNYAWPTAEIAVMGSKGASRSLKNEINKAEDPAAKLLEKKQNMLSCLLIPILQPKEVLSMKLYPRADSQKID
jgi:acetyl-CoA carboxylase carboxyltransferase component